MSTEADFHIGMDAIVFGYSLYRDRRIPRFSGVVTARGKNCVRIKRTRFFVFKTQKWVVIEGDQSHVAPSHLI